MCLRWHASSPLRALQLNLLYNVWAVRAFCRTSAQLVKDQGVLPAAQHFGLSSKLGPG